MNETIKKLEQCFKNAEYQQIINTVISHPHNERSYEMIIYLARALNAVEDSHGALRHLRDIEKDGAEDWNWQFECAVANLQIGNSALAIEIAQKAMEMGGDRQLLERFIEFASRPQVESPESTYDDDEQWDDDEIADFEGDPELYTAEESDIVEEHIENFFGEYDNVLHEAISPDIHVDIVLIEPDENRDFYTLVTLGMGAHRMDIPSALNADELSRAEMVICLPSDWDVHGSSEDSYWPLRWLKILARLPGNEKSWLGWGHTVTNQGPFAENTGLGGIILDHPDMFGEGARFCTLPDGTRVNFFVVIPIYREEMEYKIDLSADALFKLFDSRVSHVVDIERENYCISRRNRRNAINNKKYEGRNSNSQELPECKGSDGCMLSARLISDNCRIGYMYREKSETRSDSGWRFCAEESERGTELHTGYKIAHVCNLEPEIFPLLASPVGTAYRRNENGEFVKVQR